MTTQEKIEAIRQICRKTNPEGWEPNCNTGADHYCPNCSNTLGREVYLSDVLLAKEAKIDKTLSDGVTPENFSGISQMAEACRKASWGNILNHWDMRSHALAKQDRDTINFIHELLS